jgi:hypothetical protein
MAGAVAVLAALVALALYGEWVSEPRPSAGLLALDTAVGVLGCIALPLLPRSRPWEPRRSARWGRCRPWRRRWRARRCCGSRHGFGCRCPSRLRRSA